MSALRIAPAPWGGAVAAPPSKSIAHRAVLAAALAQGGSRVRGVELSQDILATVGAVCTLGAAVIAEHRQDGLVDLAIEGLTPEFGGPLPGIDCGESGSTLRFLIPVALAARGGGVFRGSARLAQRSLGPYFDLFSSMGILTKRGEAPEAPPWPLTVQGRLGGASGVYAMSGNVSSQFFTGLMLALPLAQGRHTVRSVGPMESLPYVDITISVLADFGVRVETVRRGGEYRIDGGQLYKAHDMSIEGDWSQAAYPLLGGALGRGVAVSGLKPHSVQGDRAVERILKDMGADLRWDGDALVAAPSQLHGIEVDVSDCPDLAPAVAAAMAVARGVGRIRGGARLRDKESDRIAAIAGVVRALGGDAAETTDGLIIVGRERLRGGECDACNDHRIAMMAAALASRCEGEVILNGHTAVNKSWPGFWAAVAQLGGRIDEQQLG